MPEAIVCIFAKPPIPGLVKTRLIPELGPDRAAELAEAFLEDTVAMVRTLTTWLHLACTEQTYTNTFCAT